MGDLNAAVEYEHFPTADASPESADVFRTVIPADDIEVRYSTPLHRTAVRFPDVTQLDPTVNQETRLPRMPSSVGVDRAGFGLHDSPTLLGEKVTFPLSASHDPLQEMMPDDQIGNTFRIQPEPWDDILLVEGGGV